MSFDQLQKILIDPVPLHRALNLRVTEISHGRLAYDLPYSETLVGNPETGEIHEFAITTLIDSVCGSTVKTGLDHYNRTATLDLRIDFLRASSPGATIRCEGECLRADDNVGLVRAVVHEGDKSNPLAVASGSFAIFTPRPAA